MTLSIPVAPTLCHSSDALSGMAREDPHWLVCTSVVLHGDEKSAGVLLKGTLILPGWPVGAASAAGFADKEASLSPTHLHPVLQTILASGRCQLTRSGPLPSYVVDGSSPKQPWKGGGRG